MRFFNNEVEESMSTPDLILEFSQLDLIIKIELELRSCVYENVGLKSSAAEHHGRYDMWILIKHVL